ncbi:MAG: hypothetical protein KF823_02045 [Xanthomonadales bacterium]|nr:hypothetical protein [Xanthomonadales bacterium]
MKPSILGIAGSVALAWASAAQAGDDPLTDLLGCSASAQVGTSQATRSLAEAAGWHCREMQSLAGNTLQCSPARGGRALGLEIKEFERVDQADGGAWLSVAFRSNPERVRQAVAGAPAQPGLLPGTEVGDREDGVGELRCSLRGVPGQASGSISGSLSFRGVEPLPAMRVCAAPRRNPGEPICIETLTGQFDYRIGPLPAGEYYVTAFPLADNPNRLIAAHTRSMASCASPPSECPQQQLAVVAVAAGRQVVGIDPQSLLEGLPPPLSGWEAALHRQR